MCLLKSWRRVLIVLVCSALGWLFTSYLNSPGYRAARAFARVQEGMTEDEVWSVVKNFGGKRTSFSSTGQRFEEPVDFDHAYWFVYVTFPIKSTEGETPRNKGKRLCQPTFNELLNQWWSEMKSFITERENYNSDPNKRMQQLLNNSDNARQVSEEWKRFWEIDHPNSSTRPSE